MLRKHRRSKRSPRQRRHGVAPRQKEIECLESSSKPRTSPRVVVSTAPARGEIQGQKDEAANQVIRHSSDTLTMGDE
ncbi:uncharacterized protein BO87DRAFT_377524 [Aspergillus neoniger CBS 115656]|uniref:Uncharacterized protein n=1 Tax=Aspergillus neoniger (strain CBS 115656) TaxID=1448310 RepID=A0A318YFW2_ASPNB|nr:hypothetical protein BO87DRAFT_377524 [Aspergillus neoniger CBS 115656]PYH33361.1 hypothetical protein BO87DRAFT_377524 [Aspergillus neoniger CBS 115656]